MSQKRPDGMTEFVFTHHADALARNDFVNEAPGYPMITKLGESLTRDKARMLLGVVHKMPAGSVLILGGVSVAARARSTLAVYSDELRLLLESQIKEGAVALILPSGDEDMLATLAEFCKVDRGKEIKLVVEFPFLITEFVSFSHQKEEEIAKGMLAGLEREESFFRKFFPDKQVAFFNVGHSKEITALVEFLNRKNNGFTRKESFSFM